MADNAVFEEIAWGLKSFHNAAFDLIGKGRLDDAARMLENARQLSVMTGYLEGVGMSLVSMANLEMLRRDGTRALSFAGQAAEAFPAGEDRNRARALAESIAHELVKEGMEMERGGRCADALARFETAVPHMKGRRRAAVETEIALLRRNGLD